MCVALSKYRVCRSPNAIARSEYGKKKKKKSIEEGKKDLILFEFDPANFLANSLFFSFNRREIKKRIKSR